MRSLIHASFPAVVTFALLLGAAASPVRAALAPGDHDFTLAHQGLQRSYLVRIPPAVRAGRPLPVVVNFHGGGGHAAIHKAYSRMDAAADRDGYVAVYPNGTGGVADRLLTWNAGACCGVAAARGVDDVGFSLRMLEDLGRRVPLDAARVYATGLSNGSMMAYRLAAEAPARIAAVAGVAGAMTLPGFGPGMPVPVLHIHSVDDPRALYGGGLSPALPFPDAHVQHQSVDAMIALWTARNGCSGSAEASPPLRGAAGTPDAGHTATRLRYAGCRDGAEVVLWKLAGAGHVWPGGIRDFLSWLLGPGTAVLDANAELWRFFSRFRRDAR